MDQTTCEAVAFGRFRLDPARRLLLADGEPVSLSSRGFDILHLLVEHRDRIVTKDEILRRVWRGTIVEENNLAVQVSSLRRALEKAADGATLIATIPGQGYRFVGQVAAPEPPSAPPPDVDAAPPPPPRRWRPAAALGAVACVAALGAFLALHRQPPAQPAPPPAPPRLSIAVLPFRNLGADRNDDYLADAISDDLTTDLSHIPGSVVIARESADSFRGRAVPTPQIGRALNVRYLLEGSLRGADGQYSINAQLIQADTGAHLWAQRFEVPRARISDTQETIVRRLASALDVTLVDVEWERARREHANPDALDLFLRARSRLDRSDTLAAMTEAQHLLERALALQPDDVDALGALGALLMRKVDSFADPDDSADRAEAHRVIVDLLALAPNDPTALADRGFLLANDGKCREALPVFQSAIGMDANNVLARAGLAHCQTELQLLQAAAESWQELLRIDPYGPGGNTRDYQLGHALLMLGRTAEALPWLEKSLAGDPDPQPGEDDFGRREWASLYRMAALHLTGQHDRAVLLYRAYARAWPNRTTWRITHESSALETRQPGFAPFIAALQAVGMPPFADEHEDAGIAPAPDIEPGHRKLDPTPLKLPGATTIDTAALQAMLAAQHPLLLDVGYCDVVIADAIYWDYDPLQPDDFRRSLARIAARRRSATQPIVLIGNSSYGWFSYNAALTLVKAGLPGIYWYRGGEESWTEASLPTGRSCAPLN